jgi:hypothetical protein
MALTRQTPTPPFPFIHSQYPSHHSSKPRLSLLSKTPKLFSLFATQPTSTTSHASPLIFLPFLQEKQEEEDLESHEGEDEDEEEEEDEEKDEEEEEEEDTDDPMIRFFKSRTSASTQDPQRQGKLSLQKNRRSSWHLATDIESVEEPGTETEPETENIVIEEKEQMGSANSSSSILPEGVVAEIVRIARDLPENTTLGEVLGGYEKRVGEKECVEVLGLMSEEGLVMSCLYFFEWMSLQEPSLLTPRACSVLFPVLGRARMGDKLLVLFRNLPSKKEFRDVHVYNATISGLLCSGRYGILGT